MVGIYVNVKKEVSVSLANSLVARLNTEGIPYVILDNAKCVSEIDILIVIGGDGTVLDVVNGAANKNVPILSVNAGSVGFLACIEGDELDLCVEYIKKECFELETRPLVECTLNGITYRALNEITVQRKSHLAENGCTLSLSLKIDGVFVDSFRADGIIIATPTGSTAYSLSAGGAILTPGISALIATPLCAHTLRSKPIVFSERVCAEIGVLSSEGEIYCDGKFVGMLNKGASVKIQKSELNATFIKGKRNFYETLFRKLTSWSEN